MSAFLIVFGIFSHCLDTVRSTFYPLSIPFLLILHINCNIFLCSPSYLRRRESVWIRCAQTCSVGIHITFVPPSNIGRLNDEDEVIIQALTRDERYNPDQPHISDNQARHLHEALWESAVELKIENHLVLPEDRQKPPRTLGEYALSPLLQLDHSCLTDSFSPIPSYTGILTQPAGVRFEYRRPGEAPYIEAAIALGLVFRGGLVAICSGGFDVTGPLITQIQDVSNKQPPEPVAPVPSNDPHYRQYRAYLEEVRKLPFRSGLRGGIQWRSTLVKAWSSLVIQTLPAVVPDLRQTAVQVQSVRNNIWADADVYDEHANVTGRTHLDPELMTRFTDGYDRVVLRLGATLDQRSGNYNLPFTLPSPVS
jgi:hypothetical protein